MGTLKLMKLTRLFLLIIGLSLIVYSGCEGLDLPAEFKDGKCEVSFDDISSQKKVTICYEKVTSSACNDYETKVETFIKSIGLTKGAKLYHALESCSTDADVTCTIGSIKFYTKNTEYNNAFKKYCTSKGGKAEVKVVNKGKDRTNKKKGEKDGEIVNNKNNGKGGKKVNNKNNKKDGEIVNNRKG